MTEENTTTPVEGNNPAPEGNENNSQNNDVDVGALLGNQPPAEENPAPEPKEGDDENKSQNSEDDFSARFAALARKEKAIREQEEKMKAELEALKSSSIDSSKFKESPLEALEKLGISLDDLVLKSLGEEKPAPTAEEQIQALREELKAEKEAKLKEAEEAELKKKEAEEKAQEEAIVAYKNNIIDHIAKNPEEYVMIEFQGASELVWEVTDKHFQQTGEVLEIKDASDKVEAYLREQANKMLELGIFKDKLAPKSEEVKTEDIFKVDDVKAPSTQRPTLSNDMSSPASEKSSTDGLSDEDSKRKAAELLKWI